MKDSFLSAVDTIFSMLASNQKLSIDNQLISVSSDKILTPAGDVYPLLLHHTNQLADQILPFKALEKLIHQLTRQNALVRINHIGFCYQVDSQTQEKERLMKLIKNSGLHLYIEPSSDEGLWFFIGNADRWEEAMIELISIEKSADQWVDYWLPHIQIDIDTTLNDDEIKAVVKDVFGDLITPFPISIDGVVYIVRNRLGIMHGINIMLDLATNSRNVQYQRQELLQQIA